MIDQATPAKVRLTDELGQLPDPIAWMAVGGTIWRNKGSQDDTPLYDRATIAAAVAAARKRFVDALADACVAAEIPDSKFESLLIALRA